MKKINKALIPVLAALLLTVPAAGSWAVSILPTTNFNGTFSTTSGAGGELSIDAAISKIDYVDGSYTYENIAGAESLIGADVSLSGAYRTGDYTFSDATLAIVSGTHTYFSATLSDISFTTDGLYYYLNPNLDGDNPDTLNMSDISLHTDELHPSQYIEELSDALDVQGVNGMKMTLFIPFYPCGGDFTGDSSGPIVEGLVDGIQSQEGGDIPAAIPEPTTILLLGVGLAGLAGYRKRFMS